MAQKKSFEELSLSSRFGNIEVDWPRTVGLYAGLGTAVALEIMAPPLALFIAAYPILKLFNQRTAPKGVQLMSQVVEGVAQPFGAGDEGCMRVSPEARTRKFKGHDESQKAQEEPKKHPSPQAVNTSGIA